MDLGCLNSAVAKVTELIKYEDINDTMVQYTFLTTERSTFPHFLTQTDFMKEYLHNKLYGQDIPYPNQSY